MFDPTAYENMKVVIEGVLYDLDLNGEARILDRNDWMNMAKLSRSYELTFSLVEKQFADIRCSLLLEASLENLAAELLPVAHSEKLSGCMVSIRFSMKHLDQAEIHASIDKALKEIWGTDRVYRHKAISNPIERGNFIQKEVIIEFNRLILEDQMDDLIEMVDYMISSIKQLQPIVQYK